MNVNKDVNEEMFYISLIFRTSGRWRNMLEVDERLSSLVGSKKKKKKSTPNKKNIMEKKNMSAKKEEK